MSQSMRCSFPHTVYQCVRFENVYVEQKKIRVKQVTSPSSFNLIRNHKRIKGRGGAGDLGLPPPPPVKRNWLYKGFLTNTATDPSINPILS